jgi:ketosteroid isomerase-like protein
MSEESTTPDLEELARKGIDAISRRDFDAVLARYMPDAVWNTASAGGPIGVFEGREAIRGAIEDLLAPYDDYEIVLEEFRDLGNGVAFSVQLARGRPTGSSMFLEQRAAWVTLWTDGLIERSSVYTDIDEARAAAERLAEERG